MKEVLKCCETPPIILQASDFDDKGYARTIVCCDLVYKATE